MPGEDPDRAAFAADFRVGDWLVEPSLDRLSRNGTVLRLRPQLTNLLVLLAHHAGRTVSKDEILSTVWEGQHVAESGMTRCIAELRQALDDDAREPKVLQTIPKRGYRLVAPVEFVRPATPQVPARQGVRAPDDGASLPATPDAGAGVGESRQAPATPLSRRRSLSGILRWMMGSSLAAVLLMALAWGTGAWSRPPILTERDAVLLADVVNTTGDSAFDSTLRLALAVQLGQAPFLRILSDAHARNTLTQMGRAHSEPIVGAVALELCRREGATVLLAGTITRLGAHYAVGIEAIGCATGESIARELVEADGKDSVLSALGAAASRLRRTLGESDASLRQYDVPIVQATTPSLDALKALSLGDHNRDHARLDEALAFYRRATELDPQFALAWARRGAAARNLGPSVNEERYDETDEPTMAFRRAYELRDRVSEPERFYILSHYYRFVAGDPGKAVETYKLWKRIYPGSPTPSTNLASLYIATFGKYDEALPEALEAVRLAPYSSIARKMLIAAYLGTNQLAEAKRVLQEAATHGAADLLWRGLAFQAAFADGDANAMATHLLGASGDPRTAVVMDQYAALAAASVGRLQEARRLWSRAAELAAQGGRASGQTGIRLTQAETEALLGSRKAARVAADAALAVDQQPGTLRSAAIALALAGEPARAAALVDAADRRPAGAVFSRFVWGPVARAIVEGAAGRPDQGLAMLREVAPFERGRDYGLTPLGIRAMLQSAAGRHAEAAATFRQVLRLRTAVSTSPWVPYARLGLARALRDAGDVRGSLTAYDACIDSMKQAEAEAPLLAAARRERAALGGR